MLITKGTLTHVGELDSAFGACIHEPITARGVKFGGCDDLGELLHISGLDINNVEALVLNVQVPKVYTQVVAANKCLAVAIDRNAVDVVCVGVGIRPTWHSGHDCVVMCQTRQLEVGCMAEVVLRDGSGGATSAGDICRGQVMREVVFGHHFQ